jgi:hypothetical protein
MIKLTRERLRFVVSLAMLLALVFGPGSAFSALAALQENTGSIQGTIKDQSGAVIPDAKVTVNGTNLIRSIDVKADSKGFYIFPKLPVGTYIITATQTSFKTVKQEGIMLELGKQLTVDIELPAGNVSESVTVTASSETIDVTSSKTATNIGEAFIDKTPKGRNFHSILNVAPGVRPEPKAGTAGVGGFQVDGASGSENVFILDGVDVSDIRRSSLSRQSSIPFEFVREVQVKTGGFDAEYGGALGGVINVVTKSGSNDYHGEVAAFYSGAALNSRGRGVWQRSPLDATKAEFFRAKEDDYRTITTGYSLGGRLIKDRLWFFSGYYPELTRTERSNAYVSGPRTSFNRTLQHYALERVDYAPTQNIQINSSFIWSPQRRTGSLLGTDPRISQAATDVSALGGWTPNTSYSGAITYTPTQKLVLSARYGYKYLNDKGNTYALPSGVLLLYATATSGSSYVGPAVPAQFAGAAGKQNISNPFTVLRDITTRHNVYLDASYVARAFGQQHTLKGGYALNRIANDVEDDYPQGRFDFNWGQGFTRGTLNNVRGTYGYYVWEDGVRHNAKVSSRNQGYFIQDSWQARHNVTINGGVRIENEFLPPYTKTAANGAAIPNPIRFGWGDKVSPRIGGAWDVRGDGKWKVSAVYSQVYDVLKYELARGSFGGDYWHERVYKLDNPDISLVSKSNPAALGSLIIDIDNRTVPITPTGELDGIDPDIKPMSNREFAVAVDHRLNSNNLFSVRYTHKRLVRSIEDIGLLDADENEVYVIGNEGYGARSTSISALNGVNLTLKDGVHLFPIAKREYDGVEFRLEGRMTDGFLKNLSYNTSYTWSRLYGNWAGLANSDENGRSDPNVSRAFDLPYGNFDSHGNNTYGRLATDRPHTFKFFGNYDVNWGKAGTTNFSLSQIAYSGTPLSTEFTVVVPVFINGRGDLGRTPVLTQTDLLVTHSYNVSERVKLVLDANVTNLFNQGIVMNRTVRINRNGSITVGAPGSGAKLTDQQFVNGFDALSFLNPVTGASPAFNPIYNLPLTYQGIREIRLGFHVKF